MKKFILILFLFSTAYAATFKNIGELTTQPMTGVVDADSIAIFSSTAATTRQITFTELDKRFFNDNFTAEATFPGKVTIESTAFIHAGLILKSPDTTCSLCGVDNSDAFSCAPITCP